MEEEVIMYSCVSCSHESESEEEFSLDIDGDLVCGDCRWNCEWCESTFSTDHESYDVDGYQWCDSCRSDNAMWCDFCESYTNSDRYSVYHLRDTGNWCCENCTDSVEWCGECDEYYEHGCTSCEDDDSLIHSYSYKPEPEFYGTDTNKMYLGLELETEIRSMRLTESAELITGQVPEIYLKSDSSICGQGYEIVSHPLSFNYWQNNMQHFYDTLEELRTKYNARSWDSDSCGIHIHISRNGFKSGAHMHRWINFIYKNVEDLTKYAGRKGNRYAQYGDVYKQDEYGRPYFTLKDKIKNGGFTERYSAVNTQNTHTLELRVFRGTTNSNGVRATLEFAHASVEYTRDMSISDVKLGMLGWDWFKDYVQVNNGIYPNLYSRLDKCKSANLNKRELIEA